MTNRPTTALFFLLAASASASSLLPLDDSQRYVESQAVCRAKVLGIRTVESGPKGSLRTRIRLQIVEAYKGALPSEITIEQAGGKLGLRSQNNGLQVPVQLGEERLFFLNVNEDGRLTPAYGEAGAPCLQLTAGGHPAGEQAARCDALRQLRETAPAQPNLAEYAGAPFTGTQTAASGGTGTGGTTGLLLNSQGFPGRFIQPDRGEPIGYLVDATALPSGVNQAQAFTAVQNALATWTAATGVRFRFDGFEDFGMPPDEVPEQDPTLDDRRLRIATHDKYFSISSNSVLGLGGNRTSAEDAHLEALGGTGGQVAGQEFFLTVSAFAKLNHRSSSMSNLKTLEEVLGHEIGHALGLAHSSESPGETDTVKKQALMYYQAHADNRGATTNTWDTAAIQRSHPPVNTPPWTDPRYLLPISGSIPKGTVNDYTLVGFDRQTPTASLTYTSTLPPETDPAKLVFAANKVTAVTDNFSDATLDPSTGFSYESGYYRASDGTHCSPWTRVITYGYRRDTRPSAGSDGMPDSWMITHFSSADPAAGPKRGAADDWDGDGYTNLQEYRMGTDPRNAASSFGSSILSLNNGTVQWSAAPYELYTVESSTTLSGWTTRSSQAPAPTTWPSEPFPATATSILDTSLPRGFVRVKYIR